MSLCFFAEIVIQTGFELPYLHAGQICTSAKVMCWDDRSLLCRPTPLSYFQNFASGFNGKTEPLRCHLSDIVELQARSGVL
jgi:hypothetical protein